MRPWIWSILFNDWWTFVNRVVGYDDYDLAVRSFHSCAKLYPERVEHLL